MRRDATSPADQPALRRSILAVLVLAVGVVGCRAEARSGPARYAAVRPGQAGGPPRRPAGPSDDFAVSYYRLTLRLDAVAPALAGSVVIGGVATSDGLAGLGLDLDDAMTVDSVFVDGRVVPFARPPNRVALALPRALKQGARIAARVVYHGRPQGAGFSFDTHDGVPMIASYGLPYSARQWWPCKDTPLDKADSVDIVVTVPRPLVVASNGRLVREVAHADGTRTFHWSVRYPVYPDVISLAITDYATLTSYYHPARGDSMPLTFYVYPQDVAKAQRDFAVLPDMMRSHVARFGEYPFLKEKYGIAEFARPSFREHQTLPSYGASLITGDHANDRILAHELAHQWFGDLVSVRSWSHVWLNEGFATYAYALWQEQRGGAAAYHAAMRAADRDDFAGSIYIPDSSNVKALFTSTTFAKASWVLHMLRHVMGDEAFFGALRDYLRAYAYRTATTEDFARVCERRYGKSLAWFFREWIYGTSRPTYALDWTTTPDATGAGATTSVVTLTIRQLQSDAPAFTMPLDVTVRTTSGEVTRVLWDSLATETFVLSVTGRPSAVTLDEGGWVLKRFAPGPDELLYQHPGHQLDPLQREPRFVRDAAASPSPAAARAVTAHRLDAPRARWRPVSRLGVRAGGAPAPGRRVASAARGAVGCPARLTSVRRSRTP